MFDVKLSQSVKKEMFQNDVFEIVDFLQSKKHFDFEVFLDDYPCNHYEIILAVAQEDFVLHFDPEQNIAMVTNNKDVFINLKGEEFPKTTQSMREFMKNYIKNLINSYYDFIKNRDDFNIEV